MYKGLGPTLLGYIPTRGIFFFSYHRLRVELTRATGSVLLELRSLYRSKFRSSNCRRIGSRRFLNIKTTTHLPLGSWAISSTITNPIWMTKVRLQARVPTDENYYKNTTMIRTAQQIYKLEGLKGFYKGLGTNLLGSFVAMVQFPLYETTKRKVALFRV
jgi:solute carrier family 25 folate transporter 32